MFPLSFLLATIQGYTLYTFCFPFPYISESAVNDKNFLLLNLNDGYYRYYNKDENHPSIFLAYSNTRYSHMVLVLLVTVWNYVV